MKHNFSDVTNETEAERLGRLYPIILAEYNPDYPKLYEQERDFLFSVFGDAVLRISHIGSTAVPNLISKPTIDILLEIKKDMDLTAITEHLTKSGYLVNKPSMDIITYIKGYVENGFVGQTYHIHIREFADHGAFYFRDYLIAHPDIANEYGELKQKLFTQFEFDRDGYTHAKGEFISRINTLARHEFENKNIMMVFENYFERISTLFSEELFGIIHQLIKDEDKETQLMIQEAVNLSDDEQRKTISVCNDFESKSIINNIKKCVESSDILSLLTLAKQRISNGEKDVFSSLLDNTKNYDWMLIGKAISCFQMEIALQKSESVFVWFINSGTVSCYSLFEPARKEDEYFGEHILTCLYEKYRRANHAKWSRRQGLIKPLFSGEPEYDKYQLVPITDSRNILHTTNGLRLYDEVKDKTLFVQAVDKDLANKLAELKTNGFIDSLSFRISDEGVFDGKYSKVYIEEALEMGKPFSSMKLGEERLTSKLYEDVSYGNQLFVTSTVDSLTFEELIEECYCDDNTIITQVVHMMFSNKNGEIIVNHIDHEFIFYTKLQYEQRRRNARTKGNAFPRIKTFKADNCSVSLLHPCNVFWRELNYIDKTYKEFNEAIPFLQFVLETCFDNKVLIREYFEGVHCR